MDVFDLRSRLVEDYARYTRSFIKIADPAIRAKVDTELEAGVFWPEPLLQLNPTFRPGGTIDDLVSEGTLNPECAKIFRIGKTDSDLTGLLFLAKCLVHDTDIRIWNGQVATGKAIVLHRLFNPCQPLLRQLQAAVPGSHLPEGEPHADKAFPVPSTTGPVPLHAGLGQVRQCSLVPAHRLLMVLVGNCFQGTNKKAVPTNKSMSFQSFLTW